MSSPLAFLLAYAALILAVALSAHGVIALLTLWLERRLRDSTRTPAKSPS